MPVSGCGAGLGALFGLAGGELKGVFGPVRREWGLSRVGAFGMDVILMRDGAGLGWGQALSESGGTGVKTGLIKARLGKPDRVT